MKHHTLLLLAALCFPIALAAQGLHIDKVLDGRYRKNAHTTDVVYAGAHLSGLPISYYHSLTVEDDAQIMEAVAQAVAADERDAVEKEVTRVGRHIFFCFLRMKGDGFSNRYVVFKDLRHTSTGKRRQLTLIYMESEHSSGEIRKMFKKK